MKTDHTSKLIFLIASASVLQITESFLPHPLPGVRLGLANLMTLVALFELGFKDALKIAVIRSIVSSLILGTFLSPAFVLSLSGAVLSTASMGSVYVLNDRVKTPRISIIGISLIGAMVHNLTQITLVYFLFIQHSSVFMMMPVLCISGVVTGWLTGFVAGRVCINIRQGLRMDWTQHTSAGIEFQMMHFIERNSAIHRTHALAKILVVIVIAVLIMSVPSDISAMFIVLFFLLAIIAKLPLRVFGYAFLKIWPVVMFAFLMPILFVHEGSYLISSGKLIITREGVELGVRYAMRIVLLLFYTALLMKTTRPDRLAEGFSILFSPLKWIGLNPIHLSELLVGSWNLLPNLWQQMTGFLKVNTLKNRRLKEIIDLLSRFISSLYLQTEENQP